MIPGGFILQPRKVDESKISSCPPHVREIWFYLIRKANHKDKIVQGKTIKRGQLITSYKQIINDLSWSVGYRLERYKKHHCEIAMKALTKELMITTTKTTRGIIITICNYDYYQDPKNYETDSESYNKTTRKRQSNDTINKNVKNKEEIYSFYDAEFEKSKGDPVSEKYDLFIKLLKGEFFDKEPKDAVLSIPEQLTFDNFKKVNELAGECKVKIIDVIRDLENYKDIKKYKSLYLTLRAWIKIRSKK